MTIQISGKVGLSLLRFPKKETRMHELVMLCFSPSTRDRVIMSPSIGAFAGDTDYNMLLRVIKFYMTTLHKLLWGVFSIYSFLLVY